MARLLIVSRSMALAMRLADQHEVNEHPVDDLEALGTDLDADVLVLDIGDPMQAVTTVNSLREAGQITPVLLVSGYQPEWEQVEAQRVDGVVVVPLPITRAALLAGIADLTGGLEPVLDTPYTSGIVNDEFSLNTSSFEAAGAADDIETPGDIETFSVIETSRDAETFRDTDTPGYDETAGDSEPVSDADPVTATDVDDADSPREPAPPAIARPVLTKTADAPAASPPAKAPGKSSSTQPVTTSTPPAVVSTPGHTPAHDEPAGSAVPESAGNDDAGSDDGTDDDRDGPVEDDDDQVAAQAGPADAADPPGRPRPTGPRHPRQPDSRQPASPPWGTPLSPDGVPDFTDPRAFPSSAPLSPPWGETIRVGAPGNAAAVNAYGSGQVDVAPGPGPAPGPSSGPPPAPAPSYTPDTGSQGVSGSPSRRLPRLGNRPRKMQRRPNMNETSGMGLVTDPLGPRTDPYGFPSSQDPSGSMTINGTATLPGTAGAAPSASALDRRLDSEAAALAGDRSARPRPLNGIVMRPADLVQSLLDQVGDLYGVCDTAQVLADDVIERADADAAAVLVPDGPIWRVSGGVGLRPLERRLILESSHWLITEIGSAGRAVLIDDTDIIRPQLAGAPLAAWRHLLAVPVPDVRAIVVLARGQEAGPFTDRDLAAVIAPVREAAALLAQAVQTRRLARALSSLREADTESQPRRTSST